MDQQPSRLPPEWVNAPRVEYPRGTVLFRAGSDIRTVQVLIAGVIKIVVPTGDRDVLVNLRLPGWPLGAAAAILGKRQIATAVAMTVCETTAIPVDQFRRQWASDVDLKDALAMLLAREVLEAHDRMCAIAARDPDSRLRWVFRTLFAAASSERADGSRRLTLAVSVTEIAELVLATRQWTSRQLAMWAAQRVLVREKGWFVAPAKSAFATPHN